MFTVVNFSLFTFVIDNITMSFKKQLSELYLEYKDSALNHRYITNENIEVPLRKLATKYYISEIGFSVNKLPIYTITIGSGSKKVLMWSQMHGNESTTTKAVFDLLNTFFNDKLNFILENCQLCIIPMLNPDGAKAYTRLNANDIDINRDAQDRSQPESRILRQLFDDFKPDFCFNLHGQRTIFSAGNTNNPATLSFLAPAQDKACTITSTRKKAMSIIVEMHNVLSQSIPNQIGIYDDAFNLNCVGDTFQNLDIPTVLFEAGHYKNDYAREEVRQFIYESLCVALGYISNTDINGDDHKPYFGIPENKKLFYDIIIRNVNCNKNGVCSIGIQYQETLVDKKIEFLPKIEIISDLKGFYAHKEINANGYAVLDKNKQPVNEGFANDFVCINNEELSLKPDNY